MSGFAAGFRTPWRGFRYMRNHPHLWRYALLPVLLNLLITALVLGLLVLAALWFAWTLHPRYSADFSGRALEVLTAAALLICALGAAVVLWMFLTDVLCGHYYGKLAYRVELDCGMNPDEIREIPFTLQVRDAFRDVGSLLLIHGGCLALNLIPGLGALVAAPVAMYFDSFLFGREYLDYPLALRGMDRSSRLSFARSHRKCTLGLGAAVLLLNLIPIVGAVLLTTAVTGSVLLHRELTDQT